MGLPCATGCDTLLATRGTPTMSVHFTVRIKDATWNELNKVAKKKDVPRASVIHRALEVYLKRIRRAMKG
jgi:hypothetical protein